MGDGTRVAPDASRDAGLSELSLFEQAPGFVCFLRGPEFVFEMANQAYAQLLGYRAMLGRTVREAIPEVAGQGFYELLEKVYASGEAFVGRAVPILLQGAPDEPLHEAFIDFIYQPIRDSNGQVAGILVQGHDVTAEKRLQAERAEAERALRASQDRCRTLFESIDDGFCLMQMIVDDQGRTVDYRFLETNATFESHTGLKDAVGKSARELVPDLDKSWFDLYGRVGETGEPARFENHAPAMGRWFDVYANRVGPPDQRYVALVFKDVTERKRIEHQREQLLASESRARREAEEASRLKDEFLATVSHELRTPLQSMLGWVNLLRGDNLPPERRARALETIERNARVQAQLIEDLLDVSAVLAGKLRLDVQPVDLRSVVESALETVRPAADAKSIRLQATLSSPCSIMGDGARLQQVIWNLLSNAVKFTPKNGRVQVLLECRDSAAEVTVADTGRGIEPDFLPHVFERFRQQEQGRTRHQGGLGLGLAIVKELVELHGGTVSVFSEGIDRGASFHVRVPRAPVRRPETPLERPTTTTHLSSPELEGLRVVVVDDEEDAREMLRTMLEGCGASVRVAADVAACMACFAESPPDLLLSDIGMPNEDGYSLIAKVRALASEQGGDVPAIALTAYARSEDRKRALLAGFSSHLAKPVDLAELVAVVAALSRRTWRR